MTDQTQITGTFRDALQIAGCPADYSDEELQFARKKVTEYMDGGLCQAAAQAALTRVFTEIVNRYSENQA